MVGLRDDDDVFVKPEIFDYFCRIFHVRIGIDSLVFRSDSIPAPYTFLPGMDFEGNPTGIYLLSISENAIAGIQVLDSGTFVLRPTNEQGIDFQGTFYYSTRSSTYAKPIVHTYSAHSVARWQLKNNRAL